MARWYYVENQMTKGPVEPAELYRLASTGVIGPSTPVATEGATSWTTFAEVVHSIAPPPAGGPFEGPSAQPAAVVAEPTVAEAADVLRVRATGRVSSRLVEPDGGVATVSVELRLEVSPEPDEPWKALWTETGEDELISTRTTVGDDHVGVRLEPDASPTDDATRVLAHIDTVNDRYREMTERGRTAVMDVTQLLRSRDGG